MRKLTIGLFLFGILVVLTHQAFPHEHHDKLKSEVNSEKNIDGFLDFILGFDIGAGHLEEFSKGDQIHFTKLFNDFALPFPSLISNQSVGLNQRIFVSDKSKTHFDQYYSKIVPRGPPTTICA